MCGLREHIIHTYKIEGSYQKTRTGRLVLIDWNGIWESHSVSGW